MKRIPIQPIDFDLAKRAVDEFAVERQVPASVVPQSTVRAGEGQPPPPSVPAPTPVKTVVAARKPQRKFTVDLPDYIIEAIQDRAFKAKPKKTARYVVLEALQSLGFDIQPDDMIRDGRRSEA
ncbi:MAG: hypothetical protein KKB37_00380 [Alphaproteobacteria bacterium]|nr:hypothetical protein [Alphaproteobacteria bacterium]